MQADKSKPAHSQDDEAIIGALVDKLVAARPSLKEGYRLSPITVRAHAHRGRVDAPSLASSSAATRASCCSRRRRRRRRSGAHARRLPWRARNCPNRSLQFEKDDDTNYHMELIAGLANLRARNYSIPEVRSARAAARPLARAARSTAGEGRAQLQHPRGALSTRSG